MNLEGLRMKFGAEERVLYDRSDRVCNDLVVRLADVLPEGWSITTGPLSADDLDDANIGGRVVVLDGDQAVWDQYWRADAESEEAADAVADYTVRQAAKLIRLSSAREVRTSERQRPPRRHPRPPRQPGGA